MTTPWVGPPPPAELADLARHLGPHALLRLIEAYGGTDLYVPTTPRPDSDLAAVIGLDGAQRLARDLARPRLRVPLARAWRARVYRARGETIVAIARRLGVTEDAVRVMLTRAMHASPALPSPQRDLFG